MNQSLQRSLICTIVVLALVGLAMPVLADAYLTQVSRTDPITIMGQTQPGTTDTSRIWMSGEKAHMTTKIGYVVMRADLGMMYIVNSSAGTFAEFPLGVASEKSAAMAKMMKNMKDSGQSEKMAEMMKEAEDNPETAKMMEAMKGMMEGMGSGSSMMSAKVTPTDETKKIGDWDTRLWVMDMKIMMGKTTQKIWATKDIDIDYGKFQELGGAMLAVMPGFEDIVKEMKKIEGVPILTETETEMMGTSVKQTIEVIDFQSKTPPEGIYEIDKSFKKVSLMEVGMGQR